MVSEQTKLLNITKKLNPNEAKTYHLGIRGRKTWVGSEVVFLQEGTPFYYTAVTTKKRNIVLRISKDDMLKHIPKDYLNHLIDQAIEHYEFIKKREKETDSARERMGRRSAFSQKDRQKYEVRQKAYNDSIFQKKH